MPARDIVLNDGTTELALQLYQDSKHPKEIRTSWAPANTGLQDQTWRDWKNGYGYSQPSDVNDGYAYGTSDTEADYGPGIDARQAGTVVPAGAITELDITGVSDRGVITGSFALGEDVYFLSGNALIKVLSGYSTISAPTNAGVGATFVSATVAKYSGTTFAWLGISNGFAKWDGTTLTKTTSFVRQRGTNTYWATTDGVQVQRLFFQDGTNFAVTDVPLTTDPMTSGNWTAATTVYDGVYTINGLLSAGHHVWIVTPGGVIDMDDLRQTYNISPYHRDADSFYNGLTSFYADGTILYGALTGIDAVDVSNPLVKQSFANWILPGQNGIANETPIWGRPTAFAFDDGWVIAALYNSTDSYIVYGKRRARLGYGGPTEWVWHGALAKFSQQIITTMQVKTVIQSGNASKRLFIATVDRPVTPIIRLFWQSLPLTTNAYQDALEGSPHRFGTTAKLYNTPGNWNAAGHTKTAVEATFDTRRLDSTHTMSLSVSTDDVTFGSSLGTVAASDIEHISLAGSTIQGSQITPLVSMTGTATVPPVLHSLTLQASIDPQPNEVYEFDVVFSREQQINSGGTPAHQTPEIDYRYLSLMLSKKVTLTDMVGDTVTAIIEAVLPGTIRQMEQSRDGTRGWSRIVTVRALIVDRPARYGEPSSLYGEARYS